MGAYVLISVLILVAAVLMVLVVLVQNSKGGGLAANFTGGNQIMGVRKTADFLEKATWTLAIIILALSLLSVIVIPKGNVANSSAADTELREVIDNNGTTAPVNPEDYQLPPEE
ncbi:MAG: preprotein translocase subunit SecG [Bacteroidia bacterium]|nr:preprotein translocase subunit SecG [Bacteroidales bacterium]NCD40709.1 preprotein translocase subunit SecG [Bacteroidia bacterium]MDD2323892.1 preprotein translocase subunit SecG [Bacteroidales bacterium]MDD3010781.1 preprotein translocase subunit SecG [Bacteroidales bacterium]MDD3961105.1 preprotein translocase subunit SecG [Bacteroidales bacterium]